MCGKTPQLIIDLCALPGGDSDVQLSECDRGCRVHLPHSVSGPSVQGENLLKTPAFGHKHMRTQNAKCLNNK